MSPTRRALRDGLSELAGDDEAEAIAVHGEASDDQILVILVSGGLWQGVAVGIELNQFAGSDQFLKMCVKISARFAVQAEFAHQLLESRGTLGLAGDVFQDGRVGKHGKLSALSIPHR